VKNHSRLAAVLEVLILAPFFLPIALAPSVPPKGTMLTSCLSNPVTIDRWLGAIRIEFALYIERARWDSSGILAFRDSIQVRLDSISILRIGIGVIHERGFGPVGSNPKWTRKAKSSEDESGIESLSCHLC
jgi:hypothetical protein